MAKKAEVELARIFTRASVVKTAIICITIIVGLIIVCITAYKMTSKPPWLIVVLALVGAFSGPSGAAGIIYWLRRRYIAKNHRLRVELEERLDPTRKSSNS